MEAQPTINWEYNGVRLDLYTDETLFSPKGVDTGTMCMLSMLALTPDDRVLDLGCGYGAVGLYIARKFNPAKVVMADIDETAVACAGHNAVYNNLQQVVILQSDGFQHIEDKNFTCILSNPPYHTDFSVAKRFIEDGYRHLAIGGRLVMVTKRRDWYHNKLIHVFGGVKVTERDGYFIFTAEKRRQIKKDAGAGAEKKNKLSRKLQRKYMARRPGKNG